MTTYNRIDFLRKQKGIKWGHINEKIGAYRGKLTEVKNGKTTLTQEELSIIAEILETTIDYLLGNTDDPRPAGQKEQPPVDGGELSEKDIRLIQWFRSLPPEKQKAILISQDAPKDLTE